MTSNQIAWFNAVNNARLGQYNLAETIRSNVARETENVKRREQEYLMHSENLLETNRHNRATVSETRRSNISKERETERHNMASELVSHQTLSETSRHNLATEAETKRYNVSAQQEQSRHNKAMEKQAKAELSETTRHNKQFEAYNQSQLTLQQSIHQETVRANKASESIRKYDQTLTRLSLGETTRSNKTRERETNRSNVANEAISRTTAQSNYMSAQAKISEAQSSARQVSIAAARLPYQNLADATRSPLTYGVYLTGQATGYSKAPAGGNVISAVGEAANSAVRSIGSAISQSRATKAERERNDAVRIRNTGSPKYDAVTSAAPTKAAVKSNLGGFLNGFFAGFAKTLRTNSPGLSYSEYMKGNP